ncbi:hypothetical protein [Chitinophaga sp. CF418]|uniref:hypothetical protein n=1 Tax=Chitinophaga sp. CF418 TaxID=1855287 RepID=UPI000917F7DD|nr:hypothetical protein [Chitinophaga sp. CF418]SHN45348.1 hypothetical protein SAMN05216311_1206 [Chitinophaga sp. CF418]
MDTYTFITEFRGGTYISQVKAVNVSAAIGSWSKSLDLTQIKFLGEKGKLELQTKFNDESPTKVKGVENVWFFCLRIKPGLLIVNVIKTAES